MALTIDVKFEGKLTCAFENNTRKIFARALESLKIRILMGFFYQRRKCTSLKFTGELCVTTVKNDAKLEEELTCRFKLI